MTNHEEAVSQYISGSAPFLTPDEALAYAVGYQFGYLKAQLDSIERTLDRLNEVASTPEQQAYEQRAAAREQAWKNEVQE